MDGLGLVMWPILFGQKNTAKENLGRWSERKEDRIRGNNKRKFLTISLRRLFSLRRLLRRLLRRHDDDRMKARTFFV